MLGEVPDAYWPAGTVSGKFLNYNTAIRVIGEDVTAAARLYRELHSGAGGQETKLTKNEAVTLAEWRQLCSSMGAHAGRIKPGHSGRMVWM